MKQSQPLRGLADVRELVAIEEKRWAEIRRRIPAGTPVNASEPNLTSRPDPFGVFVDADGRVVVDDFTNPISNIPMIVREFARNNEGYWIEDVFNSPGWTVQGGAIRYSLSEVGDHFLADGQQPAPRAPGAEAPRISGTRKRPIVAYPESISASIEVPDEVRLRNQIMQVQTTFRQASNTFAKILQETGEAALAALITAASRNVNSGAGTFADWAAADPIYNNTSTDPRPSSEFARVRRLFVEEKGGVVPDTLIWDPEDAEHFDRVYEDRGDAVLARYGITRVLTTVRATAGQRIYLKSGQVGTLAWEKPVDVEETREGGRKTDVYTLDGLFAFVANGADAIMKVTKT